MASVWLSCTLTFGPLPFQPPHLSLVWGEFLSLFGFDSKHLALFLVPGCDENPVAEPGSGQYSGMDALRRLYSRGSATTPTLSALSIYSVCTDAIDGWFFIHGPVYLIAWGLCDHLQEPALTPFSS